MAQLSHLLSMNMAWVQAPAQRDTNLKWWCMPRLYTQEVEAGISEVLGDPQLHSQFEASLEYMIP